MKKLFLFLLLFFLVTSLKTPFASAAPAQPTINAVSTSCSGSVSKASFSWSNVGAAATYTLHWATSSKNVGSVTSATVPDSSCTTGPGGCSFSYGILVSWYVVATDSTGSTQSHTGAFTTATCSTQTTDQCTSPSVGGHCESSSTGECAPGEKSLLSYNKTCNDPSKICCGGTATNQCELNVTGGTCEISTCKTGEVENRTYSSSCPSGGGTDKGICCQPSAPPPGAIHYTCTDTPGQTCLPDCGENSPAGGTCPGGGTLKCCPPDQTGCPICQGTNVSWDPIEKQCVQGKNIVAPTYQTCSSTQTCYPGCGCTGPCVKNYQFQPGNLPCGTAGTGCPTAIGVLDANFSSLAKSLYATLLSISGAIAVILIIISGYRLMTSRGNPEELQKAKEQLAAAVIGLIFIIFSFLILQVIFTNILSIK